MAAVLTLVLAGLCVAGYYFTIAISKREPVVVAARDIAVGQQIQEQDLTTARVGADGPLSSLPARQAPKVIGQYATVDLKAGTLIPRAALGSERSPIRGQKLQGVALKPAQVPARSFQAGDLVEVTPTLDAQDTAVDSKKAVVDTLQVPAVVDRVAGGPNGDGDLVIDLLVADGYAPMLSQITSTGHFTVVLTPRRP